MSEFASVRKGSIDDSKKREKKRPADRPSTPAAAVTSPRDTLLVPTSWTSPSGSPGTSPLPSPRSTEMEMPSPRRLLHKDGSVLGWSALLLSGHKSSKMSDSSASIASSKSTQSSQSSLSSSNSSSTSIPPLVKDRSLVEWTQMLASPLPTATSRSSNGSVVPPTAITVEPAPGRLPPGYEALSAQALFNLGEQFEAKPGQLPSAAILYHLAAEKGFVDAQATIASILYKGRGGVAKDIPEAISWYQRAVLGGQADAQCCLGMLYLTGVKDHLPEKPAEAIRLIRCSAEQGNAAAQYSLGCCFAKKKGGLEKDYMAAFQWFSKAANQNHADAIYWIGMLFEKGKGFKKNSNEAAKYYMRAQKLGHKHAQKRLLKLCGKVIV